MELRDRNAFSAARHHGQEDPLRRRKRLPPTTSPTPIQNAYLDESSSSTPREGLARQAARLQPKLPEEDRFRPLLPQLWLQSRLLTSAEAASSSKSKVGKGKARAPMSSVYRFRGTDRPLTAENIRIAMRLPFMLWPQFLRLFLAEKRGRVVAYLAMRLIRGTLPATKLWAQSRLLDIVQKSIEKTEVDRVEVLRVALISILFAAGDDLFQFIASHNDTVVQTHINHTAEKAYLRAQLSLSIPAVSSPYVSALMYEAGVFAGFQPRLHRNGTASASGGPFSVLTYSFSLMTLVIEIATQVFLLLRTLSAASHSEHLTASSILLILLSLAPSLLRLGGSWAFMKGRRTARLSWRKSRQDESELKDMGNHGEYKQEVTLFGLKDWVLEKWDGFKQQQLKEQEEAKEWVGLVDLSLGLGQQSVETAFYVLLALRTLSTNLSLGSIRLYQSTASSLLTSVRRFTSLLEQAFQSIFYLAAFCEATSDPDHSEAMLRRNRDPSIPLLDYETARQEGGMRIEARDLGFTYPNSTKQVLRDVNLVIEPGQTLAIVGLNGGGKTTLVKALMGLYDHSGTLLVNGVPSKDYAPQTLHKRTSCLFQDFSRYSFTLRENVGVGNVEQMDRTDLIERAIERGGAGKVLEGIGLGARLNRSGVPDASEEDGEGRVVRPVAKGKMGVNEDMPLPPPDAVVRGGVIERVDGMGQGGISQLGDGRAVGRDDPPRHEVPSAGRSPTPDMGFKRSGLPDPLAVNSKNNGEEERTALSGGQWQRVALARAFLRADEADLVVFDEPSASLDPRAEAQLFHRIHALSNQSGKKTTTIYISHRFSTVRRADQIAVVEDGTIVEIGSHAQLMRLEGRYRELFNLQKAGFADV